MQDSENNLKKVVTYCRWGEWASSIAICLFVLFLSAFAINGASGDPEFMTELISELNLQDTTNTLTGLQMLVGFLLLVATDLVGIAMLLSARKLFISFRTAGVFTLSAAAYLRRIGLLILALAPVSIVSNIIGNFILTLWITGDNISINISLDDTDVYAIVIGLVITAVSQIMLEAVRISDENRAFV